MQIDHLALAKENLEVAESGNSEREAYKRTAQHLAAHRDKSPRKWRAEAASYCNTSTATIDKLVQWLGTEFKADTPFLMDERATTRAANSHMKKVLREEPDQIVKALAEADDEVIEKVTKGIAGDRNLRRRTQTAIDDNVRDREVKAETKGREHAPKITALGDQVEAMHLLGKARRDLREAVSAVGEIDWEQVPGGENEARALLLEYVADIELVTSYVRTAVETGERLEGELAKLLAGEES